jgi:hypothetical protein
MATRERKFRSDLTLGKLEVVLEAQEALFGTLTALEVLGGYTIATFDDEDYPPATTLALLPTIAGSAPPAPTGTAHLFDGNALILGHTLGVAAFRTH